MRTVLICKVIIEMEPDMTPNPHAPTPAAAPAQSGTPARISSSLLFLGQRTMEIDHGEQRYTLRITKDNKLILTK
jgi:hemin uptake protein HemP